MFTLRVIMISFCLLYVFFGHSVASADLTDNSLRKVLNEIEPVLLNNITDSSGEYHGSMTTVVEFYREAGEIQCIFTP